MNQIDNKSELLSEPFLKWAGGKRWLVCNHRDLLPSVFNTYFEPFLGSGAVFFHMHPEKAVLSDINYGLIETYNAIKDNWEMVVKHLKIHHRNHSKEYYYKIRDQKPRSPHTRAARFIYLNRTCWNGLYRVNLNGKFNVPIGTKSNVITDADDYEKLSELLSGSEIVRCDFENVISQAKEGDFVFVDPPYTVNHNQNGFLKYNESLFSWDDQVRLRDAVCLASSKGVKLAVCNARHQSVLELYKGVGDIISLNRRSSISGHSKGRGNFEEIIVKCNY